MLIPLEKETGRKKTKLTSEEKKDLANAKVRAEGGHKRKPRAMSNKHVGLRQPKKAKAERTSGAHSSR